MNSLVTADVRPSSRPKNCVVFVKGRTDTVLMCSGRVTSPPPVDQKAQPSRADRLPIKSHRNARRDRDLIGKPILSLLLRLDDQVDPPMPPPRPDMKTPAENTEPLPGFHVVDVGILPHA